jgi:hypothetical protein
MHGNELLSWLARTTRRKRAFVIGGGLALLALVVGVPGAVIAYVYVGFPQQFTSLLISSFGALSTVLLALVTFATFIENQMRFEKESQRTLVHEELREVLQPSASRLEANRSHLNDDIVDWHRFDGEQWQNATVLGFELEPLHGRPNADAVVFERFFGRAPAIAEQFDEHDDQVEQLATAGRELVETLTKPLEEYIEKNDIEHASYSSPKWMAVYVLNDVDELPDINKDQDVWAEYKDEFRAVAEDVASDDLENFRQLKREYLAFGESLKQDVEETRGDLQREYNISLNDQLGSQAHESPDSSYSAV